MRYLKQQLLLFFVLMVLLTTSANAQFEDPQIIKIEGANAFLKASCNPYFLND